MEHIYRIIVIITLSSIIFSCSYKKGTINVDQKETNLYSLTTYRNVYNKYGKLETVFTDEERFSITGSSSSKELHYIYKNDTVLAREEEYNILPNGNKELFFHCMHDENSEKFVILSNKDTIEQGHILYENGLMVYKRIKMYENTV